MLSLKSEQQKRKVLFRYMFTSFRIEFSCLYILKRQLSKYFVAEKSK